MTGALTVTGGVIVTAEDEPRIADLTVVGGRAAHEGEAAQTLDASGKLVLPGLVDAHDHLRSFRAATCRSERMALPELLRSSEEVSRVAGPRDYRTLTALAAGRLLRSGVTSVIDHIYPLHRDGLLEAAVAGYSDVGIRAAVAVGLLTRGAEPIRSTPHEVFKLIDRVVDQVLPAERLFVAPVSLRQADVDAYRAAVHYATGRGVRLYTHIAESDDEVRRCLAEHGVRPVELLRRIGFLLPGTVLAHCVQLDEHDIEVLADAGCTVVYCPSNHLKLAKGFSPVTALREAGVNVCLGVDGMDDLFVEMRQAAYSQGTAVGEPGALTSRDAFAMATVAGAEAMGGGPDATRLDGGHAADLVTVGTAGLHMQPLADPLYATVHRAHGTDVADVVVEGRVVVREGRLLLADEHELAARARETTTNLSDRAGLQLDGWQIPASEHDNAVAIPRDA